MIRSTSCHSTNPVLPNAVRFAVAFFILSTAFSITLQPALAQTTDWVEQEALDTAQQAKMQAGCCGAFIDPLARESRSTNVESEEITITGNESNITEERTIMIGEVIITQGKRHMEGDKVIIYENNEKVDIEGNVILREPGLLLEGDRAEVAVEAGYLNLDNARYVLHEQQIHGSAENITRTDEEIIYLTDSTYTHCSPNDPTWTLKSDSLELDPNSGQGRGKHVRLEIGDVPVFYMPYMLFPINNQRQSGFLAPSFAYGEDGFDMSMPYYFNLAPNYDATLIPRYISDRGWQLGGEFRHLSELFSSQVGGSWLADDKKAGRDRWLVDVEQDGGYARPWRTRIDYTRVSDNNYFDDLDSSGLSVTRATHLLQRGLASYSTKNWYYDAEVREYQTLRDSLVNDPYQKLPELVARGHYVLDAGWELKFDNEYAQFDHNNSNQVTGERFFGHYELGWNSNWQAGYVNPAVSLRYLGQQLDNPTFTDDSPSVAVPTAGIDTGLIFERMDAKHYQTLEPRLYYYYAEYENQDDFQLFDTDDMTFSYEQLFRDYRFSGRDRIGDANQTSIGLTSRFLDRNSGVEQLRLSIGQTFYHDDRQVNAIDPVIFAQLPTEIQDYYNAPRSPFASELYYRFNDVWRLQAQWLWDDYQSQTDKGNVFVHYHGHRYEVFSVGYRYLQQLQLAGNNALIEAVEEGDISTAWPITSQWALLGRYNYDFTYKRPLEALAGVQYDDCCWQMRLVYREWAVNRNDFLNPDRQNTDQGIFLEVQLKSLAGFGDKLDSMFKDSIYGYGE